MYNQEPREILNSGPTMPRYRTGLGPMVVSRQKVPHQQLFVSPAVHKPTAKPKKLQPSDVQFSEKPASLDIIAPLPETPQISQHYMVLRGIRLVPILYSHHAERHSPLTHLMELFSPSPQPYPSPLPLFIEQWHGLYRYERHTCWGYPNPQLILI